jgi:hypothetical protein
MMLLLLLQPFFAGFGYGADLLKIFFLITLLSALYSISDNERVLGFGLILEVPALLLIVVSFFVEDSTTWRSVGFFFIIGFLLFTTVRILKHVLRDSEVTADKICGALCVYLLFGIIWASGYFLLEGLSPGSLAFASGGPDSIETLFSQCLYYSYVTLTTLGYGDISPVSQAAKSLAYVEALTGQLYLAVLVARLVALHIAHGRRD